MRAVTRGQTARLELGRHGVWTARVEAVMVDRVAVALTSRLPVAAAELSGTPGKVSVATPRGVVRAQGVVIAADRAGIVELAITDDVAVDQRREHVRVESRLPTAIEPVDAAHAAVHTYTLDVSGGGVLVAGVGRAEPGAPVEVTLKVPGRATIEAGGHVARRTAEGHAGVVFERIAPHDREELVRFIFERQRIARAEANGLL